KAIFEACPCCAYPTLPERYGFYVCPICGWEDDGQDDQDADEVKAGPNHGYSLTEARRNFILKGTMFRTEIESPQFSNDTRRLSSELRSLLDRVKNTPLNSPEELASIQKLLFDLSRSS